MERRTSTRQPIHLPARLDIAGKGHWLCSLADFCAEGAFIKYEDAVSDVIRNAVRQLSQVEVRVSFQQPSTGQTHVMLIKPLRVINGALGGCFTEVNMDAINALLEMAGSMPVRAPNLDHSETRLEFMMHQCSRTMREHLSEQMDGYFQTAAEQLEAGAKRASSDQLSNEFMDAASLLTKRKNGVASFFLDAIEQPIKKTKSGINAENDDLSLIEKNEFEDWLTAKVMITKAESQYRELLLQLRMRLDKVGLINETGFQNPLGPALIVYAFSNAIVGLKFKRQIEKLVLRVFENVVLKNVEGMYVAINEIFIRNNILPDLNLTKFMSPQKVGSNKSPTEKIEPAKPETQALDKQVADDENTPEPTVNVPNNNSVQEPKNSASPIPRNGSGASRMQGGAESFVQHQQAARKAYANLTQLFSKLGSPKTINTGNASSSETSGMSGQPEAVQPAVPVEEASYEEISSTLETIQTANTAVEPETFDENTPSLTAKVLSSLSVQGNTKKALPAKQSETLDVVDRFFVSLRKSAKLSEKAKAQLKQLEVPVYKSLMKDASLFEQEESPIRAVINRVAQLGLKGGRPNDGQGKKVSMLVARVNAEAEKDPRVFDEVLAELDELIDRQNLLYRKNVERVTSAAEGGQKVAQAKFRVNEEISRRVAGKTVPKAVMTLINSGWKDLLALTLIRQGEESQVWYDYLGVLDQLLAYADNTATPINLSALLTLIKEGLSSISMNNTPSGHIRDELKKFLITKAAPEMVQVPVIPPPSEEAELEPLKDSRKRSLKRWLERVQKLSEGDWLKNQKDPKNIIFMRLVWVGDHDNRYVFVNHQGMKVIDLAPMQMAAWMQKGWLELAQDYGRSVVDEGLDNMVRDVYEQLSFATAHDPLTGLLNRKEFERSTDIALAKANTSRSIVMMHIDLRHFRVINDDAGYETGDELLKNVANVLKDYVPRASQIGRLGGNEFGILLGRDHVETLCQQMVHKISKLTVVKGADMYSVGANIGLAELTDVVNSTSALLSGAEHACRAAKQVAINHFAWFEPAKPARVKQKRVSDKLESIQHKGIAALNSESVLLKSQKIIPLHNETKLGAQHEILISMYDEKGGLIPAYELITTAERKNQIQDLDRWVVSYMLEWMQTHPSQLESLGGISINLSGSSLNDAALVEDIFNIMSKSDAPLDKLWFEITEAATISNLHDVADFMTEMQELGCHFCLGNFGSGAYTYHFLRALPVDLIKIDGSFMKELVRDQNDQAMVKSMAEMVHFMGKELIASQVEDKQTLDFLVNMGVDYAQGFYIERPKLIIDT